MGVHSKGIGWTAERDAALREAWAAGVTAKQFAIDLGGFEHTKDGGKNSVISRVHALGLPKRRESNPRISPETRECRRLANVAVQNAKRSARDAGLQFDVAKFKAEEGGAASQPSAPAHQPTGISFGDLHERKASEPNQCRYPTGDVGPGLLFCGSETLPGESYCGHCYDICHEPKRSVRVLTPEQVDARRDQGRALGFANVRKSRGHGRTFTPSMVPVVNGEAIV